MAEDIQSDNSVIVLEFASGARECFYSRHLERTEKKAGNPFPEIWYSGYKPTSECPFTWQEMYDFRTVEFLSYKEIKKLCEEKGVRPGTKGVPYWVATAAKELGKPFPTTRMINGIKRKRGLMER